MVEDNERHVITEEEIEKIIKDLERKEEERQKIFEKRQEWFLKEPPAKEPPTTQTGLKPPVPKPPIAPPPVVPPSPPPTPQQPKPKPKPSPIKSFFKYLTLFLLFSILFYFGLNYKSYFLSARYTINVDVKKQPSVSLPSVADTDEVNLPDCIIIPKINVEAPIIWQVEDKDILSKLDEGVVHFKGTALPNEVGNTALTGHSSSYPWKKTKYGQVFSLLDKLEPNDDIIIVYNKKRYAYKVFKKEIISPQDVQVLTSNDSKLTLITCWPIGTTLKRLVVYANQTERPPPPSKELFLPTVF